MRVLRQCLRTFTATLVATLCLAQAAQAQTSLQSPAFNPPPAPGTSEALLDGFERRLMQTSGQLITLRLSGRDLTGIFYAPLGIFWELDKASGTVRSAALMTRTRDQLYLDRGGHILLTDPETHDRNGATASGTSNHPLTIFHDRLLARALTHPIADLPAGSRFERYAGQGGGGIVRLPGAGDTETIPARALWRSLGDHIVITQGDGRTTLLHWRELDAALKTKTNEG